jgi:plasmid stabilization system protein ParE
MNAEGPGERPTVYAIRFSERARGDIAEAWERMAELTDEETADEWETALIEEVGKLATFPNGYPAIAEARRFPGSTVRQMLHRRTTSSTAVYRVVFVVQEGREGNQDGPVVSVIHVRHASRRPITASEAAELRGSMGR